MPGAILALDFGRYTGWAIEWPNGRIESGSRDFADIRDDGERFLAFRRTLGDRKLHIEANGAELVLVIFEAIYFLQNSARAAHLWGGYWALTLAWTQHHEIARLGIPPAAIKRAVTGDPKAKKPAVMAAVQDLVHRVHDDDEADAVGLLLTNRARRAAA